jgi:hypothetical protein
MIFRYRTEVRRRDNSKVMQTTYHLTEGRARRRMAKSEHNLDGLPYSVHLVHRSRTPS